MPPRTRTQSSGATSTRSTRSGASRRSGESADTSSSVDFSASTRASSVSASAGNSYGTSPTPTEFVPLAPTTTPVDMLSSAGALSSSLDALYAPTATYVNLVHMEQMAQYLQAPETQQSLDTLLSVVKVKEKGGSESHENGDGDDNDDDTPDYHTALDELDYLEGLFKKLRFSYKEQLTKETVVRRILELELPLLSAADIDRIVQSTEAERQLLRQVKSEGREQGAAAERLIRDLAAERRYISMAESEATQLPDRVLRLRHRLARMKLALRAELDAIDRVSLGGAAAPAASTIASHPCTTCGHSFYSEAFHQLHQAMHAVQKGSSRQDASASNTSNLVDFGDEAAAAAATSATAMQRCHGCAQMVPALFVASAPPKGESHKAFHARIQKATADAHQKLAASSNSSSAAAHAMLAQAPPGSGGGGLDMALQGETEEAVKQLKRSEADLAALEKRVRSEAERQAAIEGEMTQSLQHLRESVGSIRLEMARIEQEADRMVQYIEEGRTYLGRSLQEQTDLFDVLLLGDDNDGVADDEDEDEDEEMQD
ncbi:hypothetical protein SCUCBS95973_004776 [Sporothrix curviconia]|uniref:C2H2-type domain-containing protein n=1 Tax=Sporothrix curviconia TaxID=1260050 RepID=A0ABP0BS67_9PEZI